MPLADACAILKKKPGGDAMRKRIRPFLVALLVPALALVSVSPVVEAAEAKPMRWSDPATWPNRKLPVARGLRGQQFIELRVRILYAR